MCHSPGTLSNYLNTRLLRLRQDPASQGPDVSIRSRQSADKDSWLKAVL